MLPVNVLEPARISKLSWFRREIRTHGIELDVSNNIAPLLRGAYPSIKRLALPERTRSAQQLIGPLRGDSLHELRDPRCGSSGVDQKMDVIRHDDKRDEVVQGANPLAIANGLGN